MKERADKILVSLGHFDSRASARAAIEAGGVTVNGQTIRKPSEMINPGAEISATAAHPYVSRGGLKLAHGLATFSVPVEGRICLDIGASTGGFTDVLLRAGATHVYAVDVGRDQMHVSLRDHPKVTVMEGQDARALTRTDLLDAPQLLVCDASFIALEKLLEVPLSLAAAQADFVGLFKPQFQVGRGNVGKKGIVTDADAIETARQHFAEWMKEKGWPILQWTASPVLGGDGNAEHLFYARRQ